ncbi:DUF2167 domain-containing protein [Clostridium saccharoperbutylacetonicum]|uniref:DUF2167 domain-containing protein n=1 Tax=Clostridium saccharoperbutylacetonicum TaxID=36745 RepID=UPI0039EC36ED
MFKKILTVLVVAIMVIANSSIVYASDSTNDTNEINWIQGPKTVDVGTGLAKLDLPEEYVFADGKDAKKLMKEMDNFITDKEQGIVFSKDEKENWYVLFEFDDIGYIKDSDSKNIDADALLADIKKGTQEDNEERRKSGKSTIDIIGWDEKPHYDPNTHNLVWSVLSTSKGEKIVNYNVRILGRGGVTEVTLVAGKDEMDKVKPKLATIISKYSYKEGKRYSDYIKGDKASEIGLTALIAGGAGAGAAKVGLLAKILLIFKKVWILIIVGIGGLFKGIFKVFKRKSKDDKGINTNSEETGFKENPNIDEI